jgi:NADP-dependent aldehyde dehydrogenase
MQLHGKNLIGARESGQGSTTISGYNPRLGEKLETLFTESTPEEIDSALELAASAAPILRELPAEKIAGFLERIASELNAIAEPLTARAVAESGLPIERLNFELGRTTGQILMFAGLVREGSWVDARIDHAIPDRTPAPKPDIRRVLIPIGPVVVFGASNFPLAFSVPGGDTASALAARNPVVCKAHPAHPGTSELAARAILAAVEACGLPDGTFSLVHGAGHETGLRLVRHPATRAVAFTGSLRGGRALMDAAAARKEPIPVYAEMGSVNPFFILPEALAENGPAIAQGLRQSVTLGVGQFCVCPGVIVGMVDDQFASKLRDEFSQARVGTMLHPGILAAYQAGVRERSEVAGVATTVSTLTADPSHTEASPALFETTAARFLEEETLRHENFGPSTVLVRCGAPEEMEAVARGLEGTLTATVHGTPADFVKYRGFLALLETKAGRLLLNGYPTGVEVCPSMHHGGPYPATSDAKYTSVGTAAILRFARPICYQNFPQELLPPELRDANEGKLWRTVDGVLTNK